MTFIPYIMLNQQREDLNIAMLNVEMNILMQNKLFSHHDGFMWLIKSLMKFLRYLSTVEWTNSIAGEVLGIEG